MRGLRFIRLCALAVATGLLCGCGTILTYVDGQGGFYSGVRADAALLGTVGNETHDIPVFPFAIPLSITDMPLSAAADTLCLPVVLITGDHYGNRERRE